MQRNDTTTIDHPHRRDQDPVYIRQPAYRALVWWGARAQQAGAHDNHDQSADARIAADIETDAKSDPTLAALINLARGHLAATGESDYLREWRLAGLLRNEHDRLEPLPAYEPVVYSDDDRCRHGRLFTDECTDCEI